VALFPFLLGVAVVVCSQGSIEHIARRNSSGRHQVLHHRLVRQRINLQRRLTSSIALVQASVFEPSMFMAQEPHTPSRRSGGR